MTSQLGCGECTRAARPEGARLSTEELFEDVGWLPHRQAGLWRCRFCRTWWEVPAFAPAHPISDAEVVSWMDVGDFEPREHHT